jgi:SAM-dependent methyltransferase
MSQCPVTDPSPLEMLLFGAGLVERIPLPKPGPIADVDEATLLPWHESLQDRAEPDVHNPNGWGNSLWGCTRWEFFAYAFRNCRRILDAGCGEGRLVFYLHRRQFDVTGLDICPGRLAEARGAARALGLADLVFEQGNIEALPYDDASFDGVSASSNVFVYDYDTRRMFAEIHRVLHPGGIFVIEQWRGDPDTPPVEKPGRYISVDPPALRYLVSRGLHNRAHTIFLRAGSRHAHLLAAVGPNSSDDLSDEQKQACERILQELHESDLSCVERVTYSGDHRWLAPKELPRILADAGFVDFTSWGVPDGQAFARSLEESGLLAKLKQEDLLPYLRALVASATQFESWEPDNVTCRKP